MNYNGLDKQLLEAFEKWKPKIYSWIKKLNLQNDFDVEDLVQDAMKELLWAKSTFDESKGMSFNSWAYKALMQYFLNRVNARYALSCGETKSHIDYDSTYDLGFSDDIEEELVKKDTFERLLAQLSSKGQIVVSVLFERDNEYSRSFWNSFYSYRDSLIQMIRKNQKKRLRLSVEKVLMEYLEISTKELKELYEEISVKIREVG